MALLFLLTLNAAKIRLAADFADHLHAALPAEPCDLFVFGFQEVCSLLDGSFPKTVNRHMIDINRLLLDALHRKYWSETLPYDFSTVGLHHVGAIGMIAVSPLGLRFRDCRFASATCGALHSLLKGAVGMRIAYFPRDLAPTELTFACAHLNAYEGEAYYQRRVADLHTVMRALVFGDGYSLLKPQCHTFLMGDLNFRTSKSPRDSVRTAELLDLHERASMAGAADEIGAYVSKYDELAAGRANGEFLTGFAEHPIAFLPTYKYHLDTAIYNTKRCPLWCDRILYQSTYARAARPEVHCYSSLDSYKHSDHRAVYLHMSVPATPPESIIGENGFLVVLPDGNLLGECISGPTLTYMKCTLLDKVNQLVVRRIGDFCIGYGLWFGTTPRGRVLLLALFLVLWLALY